MESYELGNICDDCTVVAANNDWSGIEDADEERIRAGFARVDGHVVVGDEYGFSWHPCAICGDARGGNRHEASVLR